MSSSSTLPVPSASPPIKRTTSYNLPDGSIDTELEIIRSRSRSQSQSGSGGYKGGDLLNPIKSRISIHPRIEEEGSSVTTIEEDEGIADIDGHLDAATKALYDQFSPSQKRRIVFTVAYCALLAPFASASFLPSIPEIVVDLNTTAVVVNASVAIFIVVLAVFPLLWSSYSGIVGRRPIYLVSLPIFALGSLGVALCTDLTQLVITRILQGIGSSAVLAVGAGSIGDIYPRSQRGTALGFFYLLVLVGPATAPFFDGLLTEYVKPEGWRAMQYLLFAMGIAGTGLVYWFLPETIHHKNIVEIREERRLKREEKGGEMSKLGKFMENYLVFVNPVAPLKMLLYPHILFIALNSSFILMSTYSILVPLALTLAPRYNITNIAIVGLLYLAPGLGNLAAAQVIGKFSDWMLRYRRKKNGVYVPEDRLYASLFGAGFLQPVSVLALGWVLERSSGTGGLIGSLFLLFATGLGLMSVLTPTNTYLVDVMQDRSAEVIAVNNFMRYMFSAAASGFVLPMINKVGVGWTSTLFAFLAWLGFLLILLTIKFGDRMRSFANKLEGIGQVESKEANLSEK